LACGSNWRSETFQFCKQTVSVLRQLSILCYCVQLDWYISNRHFEFWLFPRKLRIFDISHQNGVNLSGSWLGLKGSSSGFNLKLNFHSLVCLVWFASCRQFAKNIKDLKKKTKGRTPVFPSLQPKSWGGFVKS
jgi:hypothetical protein